MKVQWSSVNWVFLEDGLKLWRRNILKSVAEELHSTRELTKSDTLIITSSTSSSFFSCFYYFFSFIFLYFCLLSLLPLFLVNFLFW